MLANLLERHAVASIILAWSSKTHTTVRKYFPYNLRNLAHSIVVRSIANVEYFIVDCFGGSLQHRDNRPRNVQPMHQRPPRRSIAGHLDFPGCPCQPSEVVQYNVKPHSRRRTIGSSVAHEDGRKYLVGELFHVTLNQGLAYGIGSLRVNAGILGYLVLFRNTIHAAGRHINEALYSGLTGEFSEMNRALMIDFVSNGRLQLAGWIIGQFGHMNDGIHALKVFQSDVTKVLRKRHRRRSAVLVQRAFFVEARVQANDFIALLDQLRR